MHVLYVSKAMAVATYRAKLRHLSKHIRVTAIVPERWGPDPVEPGNGQSRFEGDAELIPLRAWLHGHNHFHWYAGLERVVREVRPDLIHIDEEPYSAVTFQLTLLGRKLSTPVLFFAWQNLAKRIPPPFRWTRSFVFQRAAGGIAGSEQAAHVLRGWGFKGRLEVLPQMGVDPEQFRPSEETRRTARERLSVPPATFLAGFAGRLVAEKGVLLLMRTLKVLPEIHLLFVGDGPVRAQLERTATEVEVAGRVHFLGHVDSREVAGWLPALDVLVLPSLTTRSWAEQFGRVLIEAMASGVPVVGSDSGEIPKVIGNAGIVVPEGSVTLLAKVLQDLCGDPAQRRSLAAAGRARVVRHFTHQRIADSTIAFYDQLLGPQS